MTNANTISATPTPTPTPWPGIPPRYAGNEMANLADALQSNVLWYLRKDGWASRLTTRAKQVFAVPHVATTSSGTAAIHAALAAVGVGPGMTQGRQHVTCGMKMIFAPNSVVARTCSGRLMSQQLRNDSKASAAPSSYRAV